MIKKVLTFKWLGLAAAMMVTICALSSHSVSALSSANYTSHLIDDSVMRASGTMSPGDIQSFLQSKGSGLANFYDVENCGSTSGSHWSFYATFYSCNTRIPASKIIYDAAHAYGINPQVILATLQKEQSLITTPNPVSSQLNYAMGYGCPDSGGCSTTGFFNQIDNGTWQFRVDMELASNNSYWGYSPSSYPCNGATRYYSAALKPGNNVTFYDDHGTGYAQFVIPNAATSTLYCYTPHVYPGSGAEYYSGSYNFVTSFTNWFGSTYGVYGWYTTGYKVLDSSGSYYVDPGQLVPGQRYMVDLAATNTGTASWTNSGYSPVRLGTTYPQNHSSSLCDTSWITCSRPTTLKESNVDPGQVGHFDFMIQVPFAAGSYREYFKPLAENNAWTNDSDQSLGIRVVSPGTYSWYTTGYKVLDSSGSYYVDPGQLQASTKYLVDTAVTNTGSATWQNSGLIPVRFGTTNSQGHPSQLCSTEWIACSRPVGLRESSVSPGQTGHFDFYIMTPAAHGSYREYFKPLAEGYAWTNDSDQSLGIQVTH